MKGSAAYTESGERIRNEVNRWIRSGGAYGSVVDFAVSSPTAARSVPPTTAATTSTSTTPVTAPSPTRSTSTPCEP